MTNEKTISIHLERAVRQWAVNAFGSPLRFPTHSPSESLVMHAVIPSFAPLDTPPLRTGNTLVVVPVRTGFLAEAFDLSEEGAKMVEEEVNRLFEVDLWTAMLPNVCESGLNLAIYNWCRKHGIDYDVEDTVRQRFYRLRERYRRVGVALGKQYKKTKKR